MAAVFQVSAGSIMTEIQIHQVDHRNLLDVKPESKWICHIEWDEIDCIATEFWLYCDSRIIGAFYRDSVDAFDQFESPITKNSLLIARPIWKPDNFHQLDKCWFAFSVHVPIDDGFRRIRLNANILSFTLW